MNEVWDAVVVGGGVAGLSAAQMLGRSRRRTLVIDAGRPRNRAAAAMHGVLGQDGVDPARLLATGRAEASRYGVELAIGTLVSLADDGGLLRIVRDDGSMDRARVVVLATGVRDELPPVPGLAAEWGRRVLHCPYCHGWEVAGRRLAVLATSPQSVHQMELARQLSDEVVAFTAAAGRLPDDALARLVARGVRLVTSPVMEVRSSEDGLHVSTQDGGTHRVAAVFTGGDPVIDLGFASDLHLRRSDAPGAPLVVDQLGTTSDPRVFAAGNAVAPFGNVPVSMASGSMAGAGANAALVAQDAAAAIARRAAERGAAWEQHYSARETIWSGRVNPTVAQVAGGLAPGTALDVGSGEGGDVVWLAEQGWRVTGVDVAPTAVRRATRLAEERGVQVDLRVGDGTAAVEGRFDLVLTAFLHSWESDFPRIRMLRDAADRVAPGGRLLVVSHAAPPPWAHHDPGHHPDLRTPDEELALLALDPERWEPEIVEIRDRGMTDPEGRAVLLQDGVLLLRRLA